MGSTLSVSPVRPMSRAPTAQRVSPSVHSPRNKHETDEKRQIRPPNPCCCLEYLPLQLDGKFWHGWVLWMDGWCEASVCCGCDSESDHTGHSTTTSRGRRLICLYVSCLRPNVYISGLHLFTGKCPELDLSTRLEPTLCITGSESLKS